jgi:hypothetical protein
LIPIEVHSIKKKLKKQKSKRKEVKIMDERAAKDLNCKNCMFAITKKGTIIGQFLAECRRFPPQVLSIHDTPVILWPIVSDNPGMYCYEFTEGEKENE